MKYLLKIKSIPTLLIFLLGSVIYMVGAATRAGVPGIIFDTIRNEFHFTATQTSGIASAGVLGCLMFIGASGLLIDRYGWKKLILIGVFLQILGEWILYENTSLFLIYTGSFINGGGRTIGYLTLLKILDLEFERKYFSILIGFFYIFSYGGTFLGSKPFEYSLTFYSWQTILQWCNYLTFFSGFLILLLFLFNRKREHKLEEKTQQFQKKISWKLILEQLKKKQNIAVFYCTASGIIIYWTIIAVMGKKYLNDICHMDSSALGIMNMIVMLEMITAGTISFLCGNRRKIFQILSSVFLFIGISFLIVGTIIPLLFVPFCAWLGFIFLGAGYGLTVINITACREFVPFSLSASAIGFVNFIANIAIIAINQLAGCLFDYFSNDTLQIASIGYQILLSIYFIIALFSIIAVSFLTDTRGENISEKI